MCGIVGIVDAGGVSIRLYYAMYALQHRGQESAGISTFDGTSLCKFKGQGLVADVFSPAVLKDLKGTAGIGHVRYPTTGANLPENIQPLNFQFQDHFISVAHNGNLVNTCELRREYEQAGQIFTTTTDTEIIAKILIDEISASGCVEDAVHLCMKRMQGSYSVVIMIDGVIYAFRDPLGIKPFCLGKIENGYIVASESVAIDALGGKFLRDIKPGELIRMDNEGVRCTQIAVAGRRAHCIFEYIYFARADAIIDGVLVYDVRRTIGQKLHEEAPVAADSVCSVPDSGYRIRDRVRGTVPGSFRREPHEEPVHGPYLYYANAKGTRAGSPDQAQPHPGPSPGKVGRPCRRQYRAGYDIETHHRDDAGCRRPGGAHADRVAGDQGSLLPGRGHADTKGADRKRQGGR